MPTLLLVGTVSGTTIAALEDRGFSIEVGAYEQAPEPDGGTTLEQSAVDLATAADCSLVCEGVGDVETIEAMGAAAPKLPILYAAPAESAGRAGAALEAGATDRVLTTGERDGPRIANRLDGLDGVGAESNGSIVGAGGTDRQDQQGNTRDERIEALLECAQAFMDADDVQTVATTAIETAERALGYDIVSVRLFGDDRTTLRQVASSDRAEEVLGLLPVVTLEDSVVTPAIEENRPLELDQEMLSEAGIDSVQSALVLPLGDHGVVSFGAMEPDAFGSGDRNVGELLAANASAALDRIDRVERIEAIHGTMREMLDARSPAAVAQQAVDAAADILGHQFVVCFLEGDDSPSGLEPVAWTDAAATLTGGELPTPSAGDGSLEAFETDTVVRRDSTEAEAASGLPATSRLHVPIEDAGTLMIATPGPGAFDESDVQLARLLATNVARVLDRVERTHELERLETVFETVDDMVYVHDEAGNMLHCTPVLAERLGYDRDEVIGMNVGDLVDDESEAEGAELIRELLEEPPDATRTQQIDLAGEDGKEIPVEITYSLLPSEEFRGVVGAVNDISDLVAVREQLDSQEDRFEYLFENIPDPVVEGHFEEEAVVESINDAFEETFGFEEWEIAGERLNDVIVPDDHMERARELDQQTATGTVNHAEVERDTQYGRREFLFRGVPYEATDGVTRGFGIYTDITEQKERERHLEVLQRLLRHNVRNEVNVLLAGIDQLEDARAEDDVQEAELLATLDETARDLLSMSQKAKRISRVIDAEQRELGNVDAASIVRAVVERVRQTHPDATIELDAPESCPVLGSGAIERAVEELVGNALQHAGDSPTVTVDLRATDDGADLTVADDGPGIPEAERNVLEDGEITPLQHGSGLGLWLVTHATAASGGTVSFDPTADGARVTLSFRSIESDD
ncbi:PAS domain S-box protein [Salinarchaeum laminariae]|uniref:PAS domain S-box protein n=1 Tax=Salinarchaeum laminariae TaxID=869888 RepID=UPI0020C11C28|nr:PAS domain S-box protein [Salinarchaeum laminariae]